MTDFPTFYIPQVVKSLPFLYLKFEKGTPFRAEPPHIGHYREYPPGAMYMYIPGAASVHGFSLKSGQSTTSTSTSEKFLANPALSTEIIIKDKLMQATDSITTVIAE